MTEYERMLAMVTDLLAKIGEVEGELEQAMLEMESGAACIRDADEADECQRRSEVLDDIRGFLEAARQEVDHVIGSEPEPEEEEEQAEAA